MVVRKCVVFLEKQFKQLFLDIIDYSVPELDIIKVYGIDTAPEKECFGFELVSMDTVYSMPVIDAVIILSASEKNIKKLVNLVLGNDDTIQFYGAFGGTGDLLNGKGKMIWLKHMVEIMYPREQLHLADVGDFSYFTRLRILDEPKANERTKVYIGKFSSIGPDNVYMLAEEHHGTWNTTYPFDVCGIKEFKTDQSTAFSKGDIIIGNDVWTGSKVTILSGVTIGDGCIIGAETVLAKSVPPYSIVVGNPGTVIKPRFPEDKVEKFLEMKWWDWEYSDIYNVWRLLQSDSFDDLYDYYLKNVKR
ncbi:MAG: CatB-related O-acetyltransferase [Butyrivibrio sp.]|nr:CatB-related O-acetyltransferase [Butyrivibrio sp.]